MLSIAIAGSEQRDCVSVVLVPEKALIEHGYIQTFSVEQGGQAKHGFHALAQMAYFQYQDDEIQVNRTHNPIVVSHNGVIESLESGLVLYRDEKGGLHCVAQHGVNAKKLIEAAYRYCTRWVRLDI